MPSSTSLPFLLHSLYHDSHVPCLTLLCSYHDHIHRSSLMPAWWLTYVHYITNPISLLWAKWDLKFTVRTEQMELSFIQLFISGDEWRKSPFCENKVGINGPTALFFRQKKWDWVVAAAIFAGYSSLVCSFRERKWAAKQRRTWKIRFVNGVQKLFFHKLSAVFREVFEKKPCTFIKNALEWTHKWWIVVKGGSKWGICGEKDKPPAREQVIQYVYGWIPA